MDDDNFIPLAALAEMQAIREHLRSYANIATLCPDANVLDLSKAVFLTACGWGGAPVPVNNWQKEPAAMVCAGLNLEDFIERRWSGWLGLN
jgi:hypothetical protein